MYMHSCIYVGMSVPWSACVDQSTTCRHQVSPSTVCVPGSKLTSSAFVLSTFACWAVSPVPTNHVFFLYTFPMTRVAVSTVPVLGTQLTMASVLAHLPCRSAIGWCEDHLARKSRPLLRVLLLPFPPESTRSRVWPEYHG